MKGTKAWYIPLFLTKLLVVTLLIEMGISSSFAKLIYLLILIKIGYIIILLVFPPYSQTIHNLGAIVCETASVYAFILSLLPTIFSIDEAI